MTTQLAQPVAKANASSVESANTVTVTPVIQADAVDFPRVKRILKTDEFSSVFRLRPVCKTAHFVLYARVNGLDHARLGVVAAKRLAPRAVTRNTIKRVSREIFRQSRLKSVDCVIRLAQPVNQRKQAACTQNLRKLIRNEILKLFASQTLT